MPSATRDADPTRSPELLAADYVSEQKGIADADVWLYDLSRGTETRLARPELKVMQGGR